MKLFSSFRSGGSGDQQQQQQQQQHQQRQQSHQYSQPPYDLNSSKTNDGRRGVSVAAARGDFQDPAPPADPEPLEFQPIGRSRSWLWKRRQRSNTAADPITSTDPLQYITTTAEGRSGGGWHYPVGQQQEEERDCANLLLGEDAGDVVDADANNSYDQYSFMYEDVRLQLPTTATAPPHNDGVWWRNKSTNVGLSARSSSNQKRRQQSQALNHQQHLQYQSRIDLQRVSSSRLPNQLPKPKKYGLDRNGHPRKEGRDPPSTGSSWRLREDTSVVCKAVPVEDLNPKSPAVYYHQGQNNKDPAPSAGSPQRHQSNKKSTTTILITSEPRAVIQQRKLLSSSSPRDGGGGGDDHDQVAVEDDRNDREETWGRTRTMVNRALPQDRLEQSPKQPQPTMSRSLTLQQQQKQQQQQQKTASATTSSSSPPPTKSKYEPINDIKDMKNAKNGTTDDDDDDNDWDTLVGAPVTAVLDVPLSPTVSSITPTPMKNPLMMKTTKSKKNINKKFGVDYGDFERRMTTIKDDSAVFLLMAANSAAAADGRKKKTTSKTNNNSVNVVDGDGGMISSSSSTVGGRGSSSTPSFSMSLLGFTCACGPTETLRPNQHQDRQRQQQQQM